MTADLHSTVLGFCSVCMCDVDVERVTWLHKYTVLLTHCPGVYIYIAKYRAIVSCGIT